MSVKKYVIPMIGNQELVTIYDILAENEMASGLISSSDNRTIKFQTPLIEGDRGIKIDISLSTASRYGSPAVEVVDFADAGFSTLFTVKVRQDGSSSSNYLYDPQFYLYIDDDKKFFALVFISEAKPHFNSFIYAGTTESGKKLIFTSGSKANGLYFTGESDSANVHKLISEPCTLILGQGYAQRDFLITTTDGHIVMNGDRPDAIKGIKNICWAVADYSYLILDGCDAFRASQIYPENAVSLSTAIKIPCDETIN